MRTQTQPGAGGQGKAGASTDSRLPDIRQGIRLLARLARVAERSCQESGISLPQYRLLVSASQGPQRAGELAVAVGVSRPTLTALVDGLEAGGLIRRVRDPSDRRGIRMEVTAAGDQAIAHAEVVMSQRFLALVEGDAAKVVAQVSGLIANLGESLDREGAGPELPR